MTANTTLPYESYSDPTLTSVCSLDFAAHNGAKKLAIVATVDDGELLAFALFCASEKVKTIPAKISALELSQSILQALVNLEQPLCAKRLATVDKALKLYREILP